MGGETNVRNEEFMPPLLPSLCDNISRPILGVGCRRPRLGRWQKKGGNRHRFQPPSAKATPPQARSVRPLALCPPAATLCISAAACSGIILASTIATDLSINAFFSTYHQPQQLRSSVGPRARWRLQCSEVNQVRSFLADKVEALGRAGRHLHGVRWR